MKKRIVSFILCLAMLLSVVHDFIVITSAEVAPKITVYHDGKKTEDIILEQDEKATLEMDVDIDGDYDYQWQILAVPSESLWVNIQDMNTKTAEISYALVYSVLNDVGSAKIRATIVDNGIRYSSNPVTVFVTEPADTEPPKEKSESPFASILNLVKSVPKLLFKAGTDDEYVHITVNYLDAADMDHTVFQPYTAKIEKTAVFSQNVISPSRIGFEPCLVGSGITLSDGAQFTITKDTETREFTYSAADACFKYENNGSTAVENDPDWLALIFNRDADTISVSYDPAVDEANDIVINVYYVAVDVPYSVKYYFQNVNDDGYTQNAAISYNGKAKTGTIVSDNVLYQPVYDYYGVNETEDFGFSALYHYPESVAADGSTVFECYYDRNYYLIKFDLDGGYGVEPIYARFGASFVVTPPTKAGFVFKGWDEIDSYVYDVYIDVNGKQTKVGTTSLTTSQYVEKGSPSAFQGTYTTGGTTFENATFRFVSANGDGIADEPDNLSTQPLTFIGTIESKTVNYKAIWQTVNTNVTVVFWRENPDDTNFSYWGAYSFQAMSNSTVNGEDYKNNLAMAGITSETQYFTYLYSDKDVLVLGDGSSVVNVYFTRNRYTIYFDGLDTKCGLGEHTHKDSCYHYLCTSHAHTSACYGCGLEEIPHTDACCALEAHTHTDACLIQNCPFIEHTHTADCFTCVGYEHTHTDACCSLTEHVHTSDCCSLPVHTHGDGNCDCLICTIPLNTTHTHTSACYGNCSHVHDPSCYGATSFTVAEDVTGNELNGLNAVKIKFTNPTSGRLYSYCYRPYINRTYYNYFYCDGSWYYIGSSERTANSVNGLAWGGGNRDDNNGGMSQSNTTISPNSCEHNHTSACITCSFHTEHTDECYECGHAPHVHTPACYTNATTTLATNNQKYGVPGNPQEGRIYRRGNGYQRIIYINDTWYQYNGTESSGSVISASCGKNAHIHDANCCNVPEHTHDGTSCEYDCGIVPHTHGDGHCSYTACGKVNHTHTEACYSCNNTGTFIPEHTHSDACYYVCGKVAHTHTAGCCDIPEHTHVRNCYEFSGVFYGYYTVNLGNATSPTWSKKSSITVNGVTLYYDSQANTNNRYLYVQIGGDYYRLQYSTNGYNSNAITYSYLNNLSNLSLTMNCPYGYEHTHGDGSCHYICVGYEHKHTDSCYACGKAEHTHDVASCVYTNCSDSTHHIHDESCLICGFEAEHVHDENCIKILDCSIPEHTHSGMCNTSSTSRYHYGFTAKYGENIVDMWPIWTDYTATDNDLFSASSQSKFISYSFEGQSGGFASRRPTMTADMCDTTDGIRIATAEFSNNASERKVNYYFESFDQSGPKTTTHVQYNNTGIWYDLDQGDYTQSFYNTQNLSAKSITGMTNTHTDSSGTTSNIYYSRNRWTLEFKNYDNQTITGMSYPDMMFDQPFETNSDVAEALLATPPYPSTLEENAYEFAGWYTTEGRYPGSEYEPGMKMPNGNSTLFAKWVPVKHTVRFFETYDVMVQYLESVEAGNPDESLVYVKATMPSVSYSFEIDHGTVAGALPNPDKLVVVNPDGTETEYDFSGWFEVVNESKKAYTPLDMPITKDTYVFADWGTHTAQPYCIHYALYKDETDPAWLALLPEAVKARENKELSIYSSGVNRTYICLNDGTEASPVYNWHRIISDATKGYAYQGTTRTFAARAGDTYHQLYEAYDIDFNKDFYPIPASHSITMVYEENSLEPKYNVFTFKYIDVEEVEYTVRYLDAVTGEQLASPQYHTTGNAVVTERFLPIQKDDHNYIPDAFYKQCILAVVEDPNNPGHFVSSPDNVITFYYTQDDTSARYTVHFMLQKSDSASQNLTASDYNISFETDGTYTFSNKFEESGSRIDGIADKDEPIEINPVVFAGFDLADSKTVYANGADNSTIASVPYQNNCYTITPRLNGTDLFIFYTRKTYPYKIYYLLYGADTTETTLSGYTTTAADTNNPKVVLADTDGVSPELKALYGTNFTGTAKVIPGYTCISQNTISKEISPVSSKNYIIFYYTHEQYTVQYEVVGNGGELSKTNETVEYASDLNGSLATALSGYEFVGWFVDEDCTIPAAYDATDNPDGKGYTYTDAAKTTAASGENGLFVFPEISRLCPNNSANYEPNIFYAKFNPLGGNLTIIRANSDNEGNGTQTFVYEVKNNTTGDTVYVTITGNDDVTIHGLPFGDYTVTQIHDWSERFDDAAKTVTLNQATGTEVKFNKTAIYSKWLNGNGGIAVNSTVTVVK